MKTDATLRLHCGICHGRELARSNSIPEGARLLYISDVGPRTERLSAYTKVQSRSEIRTKECPCILYAGDYVKNLPWASRQQLHLDSQRLELNK